MLLGFIASHIVEQLLELGYKVRGTARSLSKLDNLKKRWDDKYPGLFEAAEVPDIIKDGAYDEAIKGESCSSLFLPRSEAEPLYTRQGSLE